MILYFAFRFYWRHYGIIIYYFNTVGMVHMGSGQTCITEHVWTPNVLGTRFIPTLVSAGQSYVEGDQRTAFSKKWQWCLFSQFGYACLCANFGKNNTSVDVWFWLSAWSFSYLVDISLLSEFLRVLEDF
jgi:hypothetical protein